MNIEDARIGMKVRVTRDVSNRGEKGIIGNIVVLNPEDKSLSNVRVKFGEVFFIWVSPDDIEPVDED